MQFEQAGNYIIDLLKKELRSGYTYHNVEHTADVCQAAETIGKMENIGTNDMMLLLTAASYHDSGFLVKAEGHEEESCGIVKKTLPGFDYSEQEIELICGMIRATQVPQSPKTLLERILVDADLDYLGRDDFFETGRRLFNELYLAGVLNNERDWNKLQLDFMKSHRYLTKSAINLRQAKKAANMEEIKAQLLNYTHK